MTDAARPSPRGYHHGDLRAALINATIGLMREKRVEEVSVADAARAAGVSSGAPYRHFKDREELLAHVAAEGFRQLAACKQEAFDQHPPGSVERLIAGGCAYTDFGADNPELFHLMWSAARSEDTIDVARCAGEDTYRQFIGELSEIIAAQDLGERDPRAFGAPLWAMVHGFASLLIGKPRALGDRQYVRERIAEGTWAYMRGQGAPCANARGTSTPTEPTRTRRPVRGGDG
ncbi:MAG: TetR/AcrR family transcriptional regulator [Pseudomonadota bacterium]